MQVNTPKTALPFLLLTAVCFAQEAGRVGIEERLGTLLPLDQLTFKNEEDETITLSSLADKPIVLTLVYYRCPGICTPLLQELVRVADNAKLTPGEDYRLITISFDPAEKSELAKNKKANMLAGFKNKSVPPESWSFLTGDEPNIRKVTDTVGFYYMPDRNKVDFVHGATVIFLSDKGKIVRYLNGTRFNPAEMELAVLDATQGRSRSLMQRMQQICYAYDPEGQTYVLQINRIILGVTLVFALGFVAYLLRKGAARKRAAEPGPAGDTGS
jgi:protein SCO1/2